MNYRRDASAYPAGWLYDRLSSRYGWDQGLQGSGPSRIRAFKDIDSIDLGDDFAQVIAAVESYDVLLALISGR